MQNPYFAHYKVKRDAQGDKRSSKLIKDISLREAHIKILFIGDVKTKVKKSGCISLFQ